MKAILALSLLISTSAALAQTGPSSDVRRILRQQLPAVTFEEAPLDQVVDWFRTTLNVNLVVAWQVLEPLSVTKDKGISMDVKEVRVSEALWLLLNEAGGADVPMAYQASGNTIIISTKEELNKEMIVKAYDVGDLLIRVPRFEGPSIDLSQTQSAGGQGGGGQSIFQDTNDDEQEDDTQGAGATAEMLQLINLITQTIEPDSWNANGGQGSINSFRSQIVVRNTVIVHQRLGGFLVEEQ